MDTSLGMLPGAPPGDGAPDWDAELATFGQNFDAASFLDEMQPSDFAQRGTDRDLAQLFEGSSPLSDTNMPSAADSEVYGAGIASLAMSTLQPPLFGDGQPSIANPSDAFRSFATSLGQFENPEQITGLGVADVHFPGHDGVLVGDLGSEHFHTNATSFDLASVNASPLSSALLDEDTVLVPKGHAHSLVGAKRVKAESDPTNGTGDTLATTLAALPEPEVKKIKSRVYRTRKKTLENDLRQRVEDIRAENARLAVETAAADKIREKLDRENSDMLRRAKAAATDMCSERRGLLDELAKLYNDPETSDEVLQEKMVAIGGICGNIAKFGQRQLHDLLSPSVVGSLVANGVFDTPTAKCELSGREGQVCPGALQTCSSGCASLGFMRDRLVDQVPNLREEQIAKMNEVIRAHDKRLVVLRQESLRLAQEIKETFGAGFNAYVAHKQALFEASASDSFDADESILKPVSALDHLRAVLDSEAREWSSVHNELTLGNYLTVRQRAFILLKIEFVHASVRQLAQYWGALQKAWHPLSSGAGGGDDV